MLRIECIDLILVLLIDNTALQFQGGSEHAVCDAPLIVDQGNALYFGVAGEIGKRVIHDSQQMCDYF